MNFDKLEQMLLTKLPVSKDKKQVLQRRLNKLKRDPMGFIETSYAKRKDQARKYLPIKHDGKYQYTVVSAVYNVEKYLDEYFESLINQSLDFKKYIHLILVDDGSTDNSADIIKKWQKKYPNNIHYYYKENGGQASARNLGLQYVQTGWVTFIDPDDFVNVDYFKNIDDVLANGEDIDMIVGNIQFYREKTGQVSDSHPLKYRFNQKVNKVEIDKLGKNINLSVAISCFKVQQIRKSNVFFDDKVKPSFEDAKFIADYLLLASGSVAFLKESVYYYRKREDGSSTLDKAGTDTRRYVDIYQYGVIPMLSSYQRKFGKVPEHIQITALYDFIWQLKGLINSPNKLYFLTYEQKSQFYALCHELFSYIDNSTILKFGLADAWFFHKVGLLGQFKQSKPPMQICYIEEVDFEKKQLFVTYYSYFDVLYNPMLDDKLVVPKYTKVVHNYFNEELFVSEYRAWIPFDSETSILSIEIDGSLAELKFKNKSGKKVAIASILKEFRSGKYHSDGSWLLMDRETKADDNAEHLYRYIMKNHPEQQCYFALNRDSSSWDKLESEGFNLIAFGEPEFEMRLKNCSKIVSSHIDAHIHNYFGDLYDGTKKFVFLQHGVTKDDLSKWLNGKKHVSCFVTTTNDEYQSIAFGDRYKFTEKEVVLSGFPRYDELFAKQRDVDGQKIILIMPTWRSYLMGEVYGKGANTRKLNPKLLESEYAKHWMSFLKSEELKQLSDRYGYKVIFAPHANIEVYLDLMDLPSYLEIWKASESKDSIQSLFVQSEFMITDYSSVAFEMAYIGKPSIYYQFDKEEFFSGAHSYQKGYFDYEQHGFGPVVYDEVELLDKLESQLQQGVDAVYLNRIGDTFKFQDGNNCQRVFHAIQNLDLSDDTGIDVELLEKMLQKSLKYENWNYVAERCQLLISCGEHFAHKYLPVLAKALVESEQYLLAQNLFQDHPSLLCYEEKIKVAFYYRRWHEVISLYELVDEPSFDLSYKKLQSLVRVSSLEELEGFARNLIESSLSDAQRLAIMLWVLNARRDYSSMAKYAEQVAQLELSSLKDMKAQLLLAKAYRKLGMYDEAHAQLGGFEKHTLGDIDCRIEIAKLAFARSNYQKCLDQYDKLINANYHLSEMQNYQYVKSVYYQQDYKKFIQLFDELSEHIEDLPVLYIKSLVATKQWSRVLEVMEQGGLESCDELRYERVLANYRLGMIEEAYQCASKPTSLDTYEYWELIAELAFLMEDRDLEKYCYRGMVAVFPERNKQANMQKLIAL